MHLCLWCCKVFYVFRDVWFNLSYLIILWLTLKLNVLLTISAFDCLSGIYCEFIDFITVAVLTQRLIKIFYQCLRSFMLHIGICKHCLTGTCPREFKIASLAEEQSIIAYLVMSEIERYCIDESKIFLWCWNRIRYEISR